MKIKCAFQRAKTLLNINPTISKKEFKSLGFEQYHYQPNTREGGTWSVYYRRMLNPNNRHDILDVKWFCGTERYEIVRTTQHVINMTAFSGFLRNKEDLKLILSLADLSFFYEDKLELEVKL